MAAPLQPGDEQEICDAVAEATTSRVRLEIVGGGSKGCIGYPQRETVTLSTERLARVIDYDPAELILTVQPGARLAEIEALLAQHSQMLAFEPYDFARVVGAESGRSTIGGVVGAGIAGSRRVSAGSVRDHLLGFFAVNGLGQRFKAGGKVVKNVTGYDLPKLIAGSWGQLAVLTELTMKVLPKPQIVRTLVMRGLPIEAALAAMTRAMSSRAEVAAASHLPALAGGDAVTAVRIEGFGPSVDARERMLRGLLSDIGSVDILHEQDDEAHWSKVRTASYLPPEDRPMLWRISVPPLQGVQMLSAIAKLDGIALLDWAGGLTWARTPLASGDAVRKLAEQEGGHAMLIDAPTAIRRAMTALHPDPPAVAALSRRVREAFDPAGVFDPQRFATP
jgi:glycolate oxidase FAD binding subunit